MAPRLSRMMACLVFALAAAGCASGDAEFVLSERTLELEQSARERIAAALDRYFGTPQDLVAWLRLPVEYGGHAGAVVAPGEKNDQRLTLQVAFEEDVEDIEPGAPLLWLESSLRDLAQNEGEAQATWRVVEYDPVALELVVETDA
ncbi:MAG: hypothetical protein KY476_01970, partial [Planctomycetes bacterium]|nr:hypothetical protein [Planctomycetota bacterium]